MIAVVGCPLFADDQVGGATAAGRAVEIAAAAVRRGSGVQLLGKVGDDGAGDAVVVALGRLGIGHAALLRDAGRPTPVLTASQTPDAGDEENVAAIEHFDLMPAEAGARPGLEAADVELALRFVPDVTVVVVCDDVSAEVASAAVREASVASAAVVVLAGSASAEALAEAAPSATVLEVPPDDDGAFGRLVGSYAAALDAGREPAAAFAAAVADVGWQAVAE